MAIETIYIARHGYRSNWLPHGPYPPPPTGVENDVPLAEHGLEQAEELGKYMLNEIKVKPEILFSSPFYRCLQTIKPTKQNLDLPLYVDRGLGEWFKPDRGEISIPVANNVITKFFPNLIEVDWEDTNIPSAKGETEEDIFKRCHEFWPIFIKHVEERFPEVKTIMLITHAATKAALGSNLLKHTNAIQPIDKEGNLIRNGSCSLDRYNCVKNNDSESFYDRDWSITMNGNTSFLNKGEEMNWDFKNKFEAGSDADIKARKLADAAVAAAKSKLE